MQTNPILPRGRARHFWRRLLHPALTPLAVLALLAGTPVAAQQPPSLSVQPTVAAPGAAVTLSGGGWPAGASVAVKMYEAGNLSGNSADLTTPLPVGADGAFSGEGRVPRSLFGSGSRGTLHAVPGEYALVARAGEGPSATTPFSVGAPPDAALVWGEIVLDSNENGQRDAADPLVGGLTGVWLDEPAMSGTPRATTDARGRYLLAPLEPGTYTLNTRTQRFSRWWAARAQVTAPVGEVTRVDLLLRPDSAQVSPAVEHDARYFAETGYRVDRDDIWAYFLQRGGIEIFGFPVSRTFTFLGCEVQLFQRQIAQVCGDGPVQLMNLLDPDLFPYTRVNGSTFPAPDEPLKAATPKVGAPDYATRILDFVRQHAPDAWQGRPVNFGQTFFSLITPQMAGTSDPGILGLLNLEAWGAPISHPLADPTNPNFIYQRFQRGIMHFDATSGVTRGILLADYLKQILRNSDELPQDLRQQAQGSRFFAQYCPGTPGWLCRPQDLPGTDLTFAFERG